MRWSIDYFLACDSCANFEWMDGSTKKEAIRYARKQGWRIGGNKAICETCLELTKVKEMGKDTRQAVVKAKGNR